MSNLKDHMAEQNAITAAGEAERYEEAADQFKEAANLRRVMASTWYYFGYANAKLNRLDDAIHGYHLHTRPAQSRYDHVARRGSVQRQNKRYFEFAIRTQAPSSR